MFDETLFAIAEQRDPNPAPEIKAAPRCKLPVRNQAETRVMALDDLIADEHCARLVWMLVQELDLSAFYERIKARRDTPGRDPIDPRLLLALWIKATLDGVGSARELDRRCKEDLGYMWLCGGVSVNYHTLSDFRWDNAELLDELLARTTASLLEEGLVELKRVAQDGMRVRANAGADTYRRRPTLEAAYEDAKRQVEALKEQGVQEDAEPLTKRQAAARERAARERQERLSHALENMKKLEENNAKLPACRQKDKNKKEKQPRVSTTDPDIPVMKMGDGGFRPALNVQYATDTQTQVIVGWDVSGSGSDHGQTIPMLEQIEQRYGQYPDEMLIDGGYAKKEDIEQASSPEIGCKIYSPPYTTQKDRDPYAPNKNDSQAVKEWRERMATQDAKEIYKQRASTAECVNAHARNRGLYQFKVRGMIKTFTVVVIHVLTHNLMRAHALRTQVA
jgi:transposase